MSDFKLTRELREQIEDRVIDDRFHQLANLDSRDLRYGVAFPSMPEMTDEAIVDELLDCCGLGAVMDGDLIYDEDDELFLELKILINDYHFNKAVEDKIGE